MTGDAGPDGGSAAVGDTEAGAAAVLFLTHTVHEHFAARYRRLREEVPPDHDVYLAFDATGADAESIAAARELAGDDLYPFRFSELSTSGYPRPWAADNTSRLIPGNTDLLFLHLHRATGAYARYWLVECDVEYSGDWGEFFEHFRRSDAALLGTTLQPYGVLPEFHWWDDLGSPEPVTRGDLYRGFFPVMRLSADGLEAIHEAYSSGWSGHHEVLLPTALRWFGLEIEDFGGDGPFVRPGNENRFYTNTPWRTGLGPGTFKYRPARRWRGLRPGKLWHPVKPTAGRGSQYVEVARDWLDARVLSRPG